MAMNRDGESQPDLIVSWPDVPQSPSHAVLDKAVEPGFEQQLLEPVVKSCEAHYV